MLFPTLIIKVETKNSTSRAQWKIDFWARSVISETEGKTFKE